MLNRVCIFMHQGQQARNKDKVQLSGQGNYCLVGLEELSAEIPALGAELYDRHLLKPIWIPGPEEKLAW